MFTEQGHVWLLEEERVLKCFQEDGQVQGYRKARKGTSGGRVNGVRVCLWLGREQETVLRGKPKPRLQAGWKCLEVPGSSSSWPPLSRGQAWWGANIAQWTALQGLVQCKSGVSAHGGQSRGAPAVEGRAEGGGAAQEWERGRGAPTTWPWAV